MTRNTLLHNQISTLLLQKVHVESPSTDTDLMETGLLDSLTLVELMTSLEEEFSINISFDEIELDNFRSVASIAEFVSQRNGAMAMAVAY